jgi:hypothetical protein
MIFFFLEILIEYSRICIGRGHTKSFVQGISFLFFSADLSDSDSCRLGRSKIIFSLSYDDIDIIRNTESLSSLHARQKSQ